MLKQNRLNRPPLSVGEVMCTVRDCYRWFRKKDSQRIREWEGDSL